MSKWTRSPRMRNTDARSVHDKKIASAISDRDKARNELFEQILSMPSDERTRVDPKIFAQLTSEQLRKLVSEEHEKIGETADDTIEKEAPRYSDPPPKVKPIRIRPPFVEALVSGLMVAAVASSIAVGAVIFGPSLAVTFSPPPIRPVNASLWPSCSRLDAHTDGCVYQVESGLTWDTAAASLRMPASQLRTVNASISTLSPGTWLVVWRDRGTLTH